jgi:glycosyltransferase involved in cell wall biosynthesis
VDEPRLSICIPTFDRLGYLKEAVASARAQTFRGIEIVIGDDGESGELRAWCVSQSAIDPRVRYEKTSGRLGLAGNWNFLAELSRGEYLTLIGDDDRLLPTFAERLLPAATPGMSVVFCNHYVIDAAGQRSVSDSREMTERYRRSEIREGEVSDCAMVVWRNSVPMSASIVRTDDVRRLRFKTDINTPEIELFARLVASGGRFAFVNDYLAEYRVHAGSATSAGLTVDRLAEYLDPIAVPSHVEPTKRELLAKLLLGGVGIRFARGDVHGARHLRGNHYYPKASSTMTALMQTVLCAMPATVAGPLYGSLQRARVLLSVARRRLQRAI